MTIAAYHTLPKTQTEQIWRRLKVDLVYEGNPPRWLAIDMVSCAQGKGATPTMALFAWLRDLNARHRLLNRKVRIGTADMVERAEAEFINEILGEWPHD